MHIKRIRVNNFKSFAHLDIQFDDLNYFVGANASGKSNFIGIFQFLRNIARHGLENAISIEGGVEYLRNLKLGASQELAMAITYGFEHVIFLQHPFSQEVKEAGEITASKIVAIEYSFRIKFHDAGQEFDIVADQLTIQQEFVKTSIVDNQITIKATLGVGDTILTVDDQRMVTAKVTTPPHLDIDADNPLSFLLSHPTRLNPKMLLLETSLFNLANQRDSLFENLAIYDFDPRLPKRAAMISGLKELEENGRNIALVLKNILQNEESKRKILNLLHDLLSFVDDFKVQRMADKSLLFMMSEAYNSAEVYIPATFISDGTINLVALIIALYFEEKTLLIFEEPERNIHPHLIARLVDMFAEVSPQKQIIITTHNPEIVRHANVEKLFLVTRDAEGFSTIRKPINTQAIQTFLQNEIGMAELYVQDLLGLTDAE